MSVLQSIPLSPDALKMRWLEPYVTSGLNTKNIANHPKGVLAGFRIAPSAGFVVTVQLDPVLNLSVANVLETTGGLFSVTVVQNTPTNIDLTAQANSTVFIALDVQYVVGANTTGQFKVVDAAELLSNLDLVVLAKVNVPNIGPITTAHINMGYRMSAGDITPQEAFQASNLVANPSFETNSITGWLNNGFDTAAASTDTAHTGTYSLKLIKTVAGAPFITTTPIGVIPGRRYKAGAWVRSTGGSPIASGNGAKIQVSFFNSAGTIIGSAVDVETAFSGGGTTWTQKLAEVTAPALAATATLRVFFDGSSGTLYVDDAQFVTYFSDSLIQTVSIAFNYGGGGTWADGTPNPATTVEAQLDKIISDLAGASGAPKIGNAPSKILANTFTQLNTFSLGVAIPQAQTVAWPNWTAQQLSDTAFKLEATDALAATRRFNYAAQTLGAPPYMKLELEDPLTPYTFKIETGNFSFAAARIGSEQDGGIRVRINAGDRWLFGDSFSTYDLIGNGTANVTNLRNPKGTTEAARRNYVDCFRRNLVINGHMGIWQRGSANGVSADTALSVAANTRAYLPDRWYLFVGSGGGAGAGLVSRVAVSGPPNNFKYACRVQRAAAQTATNIRQLTQEIDRGYLRLLRDRGGGATDVVIRFWCRVGANYSGSAGTLEVGTITGNSATENQWFGTYTGGSGTSLAVVTPTTSWVQYTVTGRNFNDAPAAALAFRHTPTGTAGANDWFEVTGVEVIEASLAAELNETSTTAIPFKLSGGSLAGEVDLCQRYFEKSYDIDTPPGTITSNGEERTLGANAASGFLYTPGVRYKTRKQPFAPSYQNWFTYDPTTGHGGPGFGNACYNYHGPVADFGFDSANQGGETGFNIDVDTAPVLGDVLKFHWTSDCDI